jgi:hypothetical protein
MPGKSEMVEFIVIVFVTEMKATPDTNQYRQTN